MRCAVTNRSNRPNASPLEGREGFRRISPACSTTPPRTQGDATRGGALGLAATITAADPGGRSALHFGHRSVLGRGGGWDRSASSPLQHPPGLEAKARPYATRKTTSWVPTARAKECDRAVGRRLVPWGCGQG